MIKRWLKNKIQEYYQDTAFDVLTPPDDKMGDYSINLAFVLAKKNGTSPIEEGQKIVEKFKADREFSDRFGEINFVNPGFVNLFLSEKFIQEQLTKVYKKRDSYGTSKIGEGKTVIIEYGGTNIAKPMHVGHLRSTIIGDGLANVYEMLGYKVVRWNYIGDWGTQFGNLIAAYKLWGNEKELKKKPIQTMLNLYVRFHDELKNNPDLRSRGREELKKLEEGDAEDRKLWEMFREYSLDEFDKIFQQLDIKFDITKGESGYEMVIGETVEFIEQKGILKKSEGADIIELEGLPPTLIRKSDGASLYITRDIASLKERIEEYKPEKILYVVANQQALHFEQLFAVWRMLGFSGTDLIHVKFGMVLGEDGKKLATREGKGIPLQELIDKIVALAGKVVREKNPKLSEKEADEISKAVGIGALKYNDLKQHPRTDIAFDWSAMLDFSGNSGPYLQYTYARLSSILAKAGNRKAGNPALLVEAEEQRVAKRLLEFPDSVEKCSEFYSLNGLALYLYELSNDANRFYESVRILGDMNIERINARLMLIETVAVVLGRGLKILGIGSLPRI
ncbi:MAG: arginine--tRNA ligase [Candidatus Paceibacterota bacterium]